MEISRYISIMIAFGTWNSFIKFLGGCSHIFFAHLLSLDRDRRWQYSSMMIDQVIRSYFSLCWKQFSSYCLTPKNNHLI